MFHVKHVSYETLNSKCKKAFTCTMPKVFTSKNQKTGELGESIACKWLKNNGYGIVERNYTRKWGEIDIVAKKANKTHFIEVKSVSCAPDFFSHGRLVEIAVPLGGTLDRVNSQGSIDSSFRPEDNMHPEKLKRLYRTIEGYLASNNVLDEWQLDLLCVYIVHDTKKAKVTLFENV